MRFVSLFPLFPPFGVDHQFHHDCFWRLIEQHREPRQLSVRGSSFHDGVALSARIVEVSDTIRSYYGKRIPVPGWGAEAYLIEFAIDLTFPESEYIATDSDGKKLEMSREVLFNSWLFGVPGELHLTQQTYICALTICYFGSARTGESVWIVDGERLTFKPTYVSLTQEGIDLFVENGVVPSSQLDFDSVLRWVFSQNGMFNGYSDTAASKALNYYTRLFVERFREDELSDLVWALAGIESLLVEGGRSSVGQLREKLTAIFQYMPAKWVSDMIGDIYDFRSRLIHGNRQIKSSFRGYEEEESRRRLDEEYNSSRFAVGMLALLIQELISRDANRFVFKTALDD